MHFLILISALLTSIPPATPSSRCIFAHTYRSACRPDGEYMYLEAYAQPTGEECCQDACLGLICRTFDHGGPWTFDHNNGCEMHVSENGTVVRFQGPDGYVADLVPRVKGNVSMSREGIG
ncbi:hypothetical protein QBC44DRAFT_370693 [Cladorrhinum sp. PSN332]|nr:hypothetical protein QBC44DRAFT_370693 [Cladorrhinum sp. PSN332]